MKRCSAKNRRHGVILLLTAFLMVFMVGVAAFAIDSGVITLARTQLQAAADAGAIAAADTLSSGTATATTAAQTVAQANYAGGAHVSLVTASDVDFGTWSTSTSTFTVLSGAAASSANAVRVTCRLQQARGNGLALFFAPIYGISTKDVTAQAIAMKGSSPCGFVGLNGINISGGSYTDSYNSAAGYSAGSAGSNGNICSNSDITLSGGSTVVKGKATPGPGHSVSASGGSSVTGSTAAASSALSEAAVDSTAASTTNNNASIPLDNKGKSVYDSVHGVFNISGGDTMTLPAGTYYVSSFTISGGSTVTCPGQTIIYCTGNCDISGGSMANSTAIPSNLQFFISGSKTTLSGSSQTYAEIYAPASDITRSGGGSDFFGSMVGASLTLSGGGGLHADSGSGSSSVAQLVQ